MDITNIINALFAYGSAVLGAMILLCFVTTVTVEVVKGLFRKVPTNIVAFVASMIITILAVIILCAVLGIPFIWYYIIGAILLGIFVAYASMYGFDKFKETWGRFKAYKGK